MHDVLSHAVSLMVVQAEAGPVAVRAAPGRAEAAFDRWGHNAAIASTRDGARTPVYSVNSTDTKGQDTNKVALNVMVATYGAPTP